MNIAHMIDSLGMFGAEYVIYYLLPSLKKLGANVSFICMCPTNSPGSELGRKLEERGISVIYLNETKKISIKGMISIYRALRSCHADILHVHGYKATILGGIVSVFTKIPIFSTYHAEATKHHELSFYVNTETLFLKIAAKIIAVSDSIKDDLANRGINKKIISIVYNGIEDPATEWAYSEKGSSVNVLCIGRLINIKRFDLVMRAISILSKEFPGLNLTIAGSGPLENELRAIARQLGISDRVNLPGYVRNTGELLAQADVFILASETEGAPISILEAMAFSVPTIATSVGAIPHMLGNFNGHLIHPGNLTQLVNALKCVLSFPQYHQDLATAARRRYEAEFTSMRMASRYMKLYETYLGEHDAKRVANRSL